MKRELLMLAAVALANLSLVEFGEESALAGVMVYTDRGTFNAQGTISFNSNFDNFGTSFTSPGNPFTKDDVTYTSGQNLIVGPGTSYQPIKNLMANDLLSPITGTIEASADHFNMFGFDIGVMGNQDQETLVVTTNLGSYSTGLLTLPNASQSLAFEGFVTTTAGEYFTGFSITARNPNNSLPGITNVTLGQEASASATPEPSSLVMFATLTVAAGGYARWRRRYWCHSPVNGL